MAAVTACAPCYTPFYRFDALHASKVPDGIVPRCEGCSRTFFSLPLIDEMNQEKVTAKHYAKSQSFVSPMFLPRLLTAWHHGKTSLLDTL